MKAIVFYKYGSPDVLQYEGIEKPAAGDNEVLIKVRAASVNPLDCGSLKGVPYIFRIVFGLHKPTVTQPGRPGVDVAGQVEAVGRSVTQFKPGDQVFGVCIDDPQASGAKAWVHRHGAFAEYVCAPESILVMKPDNVTFEQAASVPVAAFTAFQGLRDKGHIQPGQKVLINGAAGGVGTFAVQIAKSGLRYDVILDCVGNHSLSESRRVLNPKGICIMVGDLSGRTMSGLLARLITALVLSRIASQKLVTFLARPNKQDLTIMHELMKTGQVKPVIDRRYSLSEVPQAIRYLAEKHARGKVVITLEDSHRRENPA